MPEGPEIKRIADRLSKILAGNSLEGVYFFSQKLKKYESVLKDAKVEHVETRGKALLTHLDSGHSIYSHNQLYGRWYIVDAEKFPKTKRSLRLALKTNTHSALLFSASEIDVLKKSEIDNHPFLSKIGPDVLDADLSWKTIAKLLLDKRFKNRRLASLFLDQKFLAGIGNYLRSEILFDARVDPLKKPKELTRKTINDVGRSSLKISQRAYKKGGVTNPEDLVKQLKSKGLTRSKYRHAVFGRDGQECYACGTSVRKVFIGSRRLYSCPLCQNEK